MRKIVKLYEHSNRVFDVECGTWVNTFITLALCDDGTIWRLGYDADEDVRWFKLPDIPQE